MLEHDGVAQHHGGYHRLDGKPEGEVPWHDYEDGANGLMRDDT